MELKKTQILKTKKRKKMQQKLARQSESGQNKYTSEGTCKFMLSTDNAKAIRKWCKCYAFKI